MSVNLTEGKPQEFVATISFNLNLENKKSAKVQKGDTLSYDGHVASYTPASGASITGETKSLLSAIGEWLIPKNGKKPDSTSDKAAEEKGNNNVPKGSSGPGFDPKRGGNFDDFIQNNRDDFAVAGKVIHENDLIVKKVSSTKTPVEKKADAKREVAGDQVPVKKVGESSLTVNSSTSVPRTKAHSTKVEASDSYGADESRPRGSAKKATESKQKKTFTVDATTPALHEEATIDEVRQAKRTIPEEEQDGQIVKKVRQSPQVQQMDGITLKRTESPKDMTVKTKVSSGGEVAVDIASSKDTVVVKEVEKVVKVASEEKLTSKDYIAMLPDDWNNMHWVRKEKWIKSQTVIGLLEYLISVENVNAVINACKERVKELA